MTTNYFVLLLALGGAGLAVLGFVWSVRSGQLDDLESPAQKMLWEDQVKTSAAEDAKRDPSR